jgi:hypothetical protein
MPHCCSGLTRPTSSPRRLASTAPICSTRTRVVSPTRSISGRNDAARALWRSGHRSRCPTIQRSPRTRMTSCLALRLEIFHLAPLFCHGARGPGGARRRQHAGAGGRAYSHSDDGAGGDLHLAAVTRSTDRSLRFVQPHLATAVPSFSFGRSAATPGKQAVKISNRATANGNPMAPRLATARGRARIGS